MRDHKIALSSNGDERRGGCTDTMLLAKMGLDMDGLSDTASSMTVHESSYLSEIESHSLLGLCKEINRNAEWSRLQAAQRASLKQMAHLKAAQFAGMDVVPSGKRQQGDGCEDDDQNIVEAMETSDGCVVLRITLLAAGFIIGPGGQSVRDLSEETGCRIQSWTETFSHQGNKRRVRKLVLDGKPRNIAHALHIIKAAVERYKDLCEGNYCNQLVDPVQHILGVDFIYQPPPRKAVPHAAGITTKPPKQRSSRRGKENLSEGSSADLLKCLVDDTCSKQKHADFYSWSSKVLGDARQPQAPRGQWKRYESSDDVMESSGMFSNDSLGMYEVPCDQAVPPCDEQQSPYTAPKVAADAGYHLFSDNSGYFHYLKSYPWAYVDMLRNTNVESLLHPKKLACHQKASSSQTPSYRDRLVSEPVYELTRKKESVEPVLPENYLEHMFALFDEKCQVADDGQPPREQSILGRTTPLKIPPKQQRVKNQVAPDSVKRRIAF